MAQQHLTLLPFIALLLACCVTPSVQQGLTYTINYNATNGTVILWPRIEFTLGERPIPYPQVYLYNEAVLNPVTSMDMTTEFFDVNTSEVLWSESTLKFNAGVSANSYNENLVFQPIVISPCQVLQWNPTNRWIGVRNLMIFSTTSVVPTALNQTIIIGSTLQNKLSISPTTYKAILIPASSANNNRSVFQVNCSLQSSSFSGLPFKSFCFHQQGSCNSSNCLVKGDIAAQSASKNFSVDSLLPSSVYFLSMDTSFFYENVPYSLTVQMTEHGIPSGEWHRMTPTNNLLISILLPICTLVFIGALQC